MAYDSKNYSPPLYCIETKQNFINIENDLKEKQMLRYLNKISSVILTKAFKFYHSDLNNSSKSMYIGTHSILDYIFDRLSKMTFDQQKLFTKNRDFLKISFIHNSNKFKILNKKSFSITCSNDIIDKYEITDIEEKKDNLTDHYSVNCNSDVNLKYLCRSYNVMYGNFYSYNDKVIPNIKYLLIKNQTVYRCYYATCKIDESYVIALENNYSLLLTKLNNFSNINKETFYKIFEFLLCKNPHDIIVNSISDSSIKNILMPSLEDITSTFYNVDEMLEDINEFKQIFYDKYNKKEKCEEFHFHINSKLSIKNKTKEIAKDLNISKAVIFQSPFLYLLYDNQYVLIGGGHYYI